MNTKTEGIYPQEGSYFDKFVETLRSGGLRETCVKTLKFSKDLLVSRFLFLKSRRKFLFQGTELHYFYHKYNKTWKNERAIEIPIAMHYLRQFKGKKILEVGNVLKHYFRLEHPVIDKYERALGVINEDVMDFTPEKKFDLVISMSTMEHVGVDDIPKNPAKAVIALKRMQKEFINDKGKILISFPTNYNFALNKLLDKKKYPDLKIICYRREEKDNNNWTEVDCKEVKDLKHTQPVRGVVFIELNKKSKL